jgi:hypothetical protein
MNNAREYLRLLHALELAYLEAEFERRQRARAPERNPEKFFREWSDYWNQKKKEKGNQ